jgi:hypothetical protein
MVEDEEVDSGEVESERAGESLLVPDVWTADDFFGTCWEKKTKDNTPANAARTIKTMATAPSRLFIFCLIT